MERTARVKTTDNDGTGFAKMNSDDTVTLHATVSGRVQGVGFRQFVQHTASKRDLSGWVRNRPDGQTVEVMAEGTKAEIDRLIEELRSGPPGARVDKLDVAWSEPIELPNPFQIRT